MIRITALRTLGTLPFAIWMTSAPAESAIAAFALRPVTSAEGIGYRETMLPADVDKDGDMDFFSGEGRGGSSWWFERRPDGWTRRLVSDSNLADVGGFVLDVDGDGWPDKVSAAFWYRNPGFAEGGLPAGAPDPAFGVCRYSALEFTHDVYPADFDGDGRMDVLTVDYGGIRWFRIPPPDSACGAWTERMINGDTFPIQQHGGIAAGDLDGDGDQDVSRMDRWFENTDGKGGAWTEHVNIPLEPLRQGSWGMSGRAVVSDLDGDGHADVLEAECDLGNGRVAWFSNPDGKGLRWVAHLIKDSTDGQDFHTLLLRDFDGDGDGDLFSAGSAGSEGKPKAYFWENLDGRGGEWKEHVLLEGEYQIHDAGAADMDGDGDVDILAKDWATGRQFYLENQTIPNPGAGLVPPASGRRANRGNHPAWGWRGIFPRNGSFHTVDGRLFPGIR